LPILIKYAAAVLVCYVTASDWTYGWTCTACSSSPASEWEACVVSWPSCCF